MIKCTELIIKWPGLLFSTKKKCGGLWWAGEGCGVGYQYVVTADIGNQNTLFRLGKHGDMGM